MFSIVVVVAVRTIVVWSPYCPSVFDVNMIMYVSNVTSTNVCALRRNE